MSNGNNIAHSFKFFTLSLNPYQLLHSFVVIFWYIEEKKCVFRLTSALVLTWCNLLYSSYYQCIKLGSFRISNKIPEPITQKQIFLILEYVPTFELWASWFDIVLQFHIKSNQTLLSHWVSKNNINCVEIQS